MRKMKRLLAAGLATIMACSMLTGCGGGSSDKHLLIRTHPKVLFTILTSNQKQMNSGRNLQKNTQTKLVFQLQ